MWFKCADAFFYFWIYLLWIYAHEVTLYVNVWTNVCVTTFSNCDCDITQHCLFQCAQNDLPLEICHMASGWGGNCATYTAI